MQVRPPLTCLARLGSFDQHFVTDEVDEFVTALHMPVQGGGDTVELGSHGTHGHGVESAMVSKVDRRADDAGPAQSRRAADPPIVAAVALSRRALSRRALSHHARSPTDATAPCYRHPQAGPRSVPHGGRTLRLRSPGPPQRRSL